MRLTRLRLQDFLAYEDLDLDFDGLGQLAIVGPNGAGKSTLLDGVLWSVYGTARGRADQLIREGQTRMLAETTWDHPTAGRVVIRRTRVSSPEQSTLSLHIDGLNRTRHTIGETQAAIDEFVIGYRPLLAGPVMVQGEADVLMAAPPAERKEILVKLFELDRFEAYCTAAKQRAAEAGTNADVTRQQLARLREVIDEELTIRALRRDAATAIAVARGDVAKADAKVTLLREEAVSLRERVARRQDLQNALVNANENLDRATSTLANLDKQVMEYREVEHAQVDSFDTTVFDKLDELEQVTREFLAGSEKMRLMESVPCGGEGIYATCRFLVDAAGSAEKVPALEGRIVELGGPMPVERIAATRQHQHQLAIAAERALEAKVQAAHWLEREGTVRRSLEDQIESAKASARQIKTTLDGLADDVTRATQVVDELGQATLALQIARDSLEINLANQARAEQRLGMIDAAKREEVVALEQEQAFDREAAVYKTLVRAFGRDGIPTLILENGIPMVEQRANEVLARMPGGFAVELVTQRETKAGAVRETLDVNVIVDGRERPYALLSGGERLRVDFALRIALSDVLARRSGSWQTLWIDESFSSQDRDGREAMLQAIAAVADDFGLIVCTSHIEEVIERFETKVVVEKDHASGISSAVVVG